MRTRFTFGSVVRLLCMGLFVLCVGLTAWLYLEPSGVAVAHLFLELGPRWVIAAGFLPLIALPAPALERTVTIVIAGLCSIVLLDMRIAACLIPADESADLRVGTYNIGGGFVPPTDLVLWYDEQNLDVLLLQEAGKPAQLKQIAESLGMKLACQSKLCVLTQHAVSSEPALSRRELGGWGGYAARFTLCRGENCVPLVNAHLATPRHAIQEVMGRQPLYKAQAMLRVREIESSLASLLINDNTAILAGDLNMTQQSPLYRKYWSDWHNAFAAAGCGLGRTKYTRLLRTRIDHILVRANWTVTKSEVHEGFGGDHRPVTMSAIRRTI